MTERELDVLRLLAKGLSNREIASELVISEKTVKTHVSNILAKLHLADRTQAALYAVRQSMNAGRKGEHSRPENAGRKGQQTDARMLLFGDDREGSKFFADLAVTGPEA